MREIAHAQKRNPLSDLEYCMMVDIHDVITQVMFGDDRLRGLGVAGGQILAFPIDFDCRLYNSLALPCECMILWPTNFLLLLYSNNVSV